MPIACGNCTRPSSTRYSHPVSDGGGPEATAVPIQASTPDFGCDAHSVVRHGVRSGPVPTNEGGDQSPSATRSPGVFTLLGARDRRRYQRCPRRPAADICAGHHRCDRSWISGPCSLSSLDGHRRLVCHPLADQYALRSHRAAPDAKSRVYLVPGSVFMQGSRIGMESTLLTCCPADRRLALWVPLRLLLPLSVQTEYRGELGANPYAADSTANPEGNCGDTARRRVFLDAPPCPFITQLLLRLERSNSALRKYLGASRDPERRQRASPCLMPLADVPSSTISSSGT